MGRKKIQKEKATDATVVTPLAPVAEVPATSPESSSLAMAGNSFDYTKKLAMLSPAEKKKFLAMADKIQVNDPTSIQSFGSELSQVVSRNGDVLLEQCKSNRNSDVEMLANELLEELNLIDLDELSKSPWKSFASKVPILRHIVKSVESIMVKYNSIKQNVDAISQKIATTKIVAMRDNSTLQTIFDNNVQYIQQLRDLIIAAKLKMEAIDAEITKRRQDPSTEVYELQKMDNFRNALSKRIADMQTIECVLGQNLIQIGFVQNSNIAIADKAETVVNHIIPIWKTQLAMAVMLSNQKASLDANAKMEEFTNKMLVMNAKAVKENALAAAKASENQTIHLETLQKTNQSLTETVVELKKIRQEGEQIRQNVETSCKTFFEGLHNTYQEMAGLGTDAAKAISTGSK